MDYNWFNVRHVEFLETNSENEVVTVFLGEMSKVLVRSLFHCKKTSVELEFLVTGHHTMGSRFKGTVEFNRVAFEVCKSWVDVKVGHKSLQAHGEARDKRPVICSRPSVVGNVEHRLSVTKGRDLGHQTVHVFVVRVGSQDIIGTVPLSWWMSWVPSHMSQETLKLGVEKMGQAIHLVR